MMREWNQLPREMQHPEVKKYYDRLWQHKTELKVKRALDILLSLILILLFMPMFILTAVLIKNDSKGPIIFRQTRVTAYGRKFHIFKFRTMVNNAENLGTQITVKDDQRITKIGEKLRKYRMDEIPQLFNILAGDMTFVGTRPEVEKYVRQYTKEMKATLLLPAGVTSRASIEYRDEKQLIARGGEADQVYTQKILPDKMKFNLQEIEQYSLWKDIKTMIDTVLIIINV